MIECKHDYDEICTNPDCPLVADYCPDEKVVKGLACCINAEDLCGSYCPYYGKGAKECGCETLLMSDALIEMSKKDAKNSHIKQLLLDKIFPFKGVDMKSYSINAYAVYVAINNILGGD